MKEEKEVRLHQRMYSLAHLASPIPLLKYHFHTDIMGKTDGNYIVMSNHLTESDMIMMMRAFPRHMYFVCGEHLLRNKNAGLIWKYFDPIPEYKGSNAVGTVREIIERVKAGHNIMIFPEGSRSFNGETEPVTKAAGKMVKMAGCGLVTYRIHGGYFIAPRWAYHFKKGPASGEIVGVYTKDQLAGMSAQEITDLINRDLHENAYDRQRTEQFSYKGEGLCEGLENYLEICPECGSYDTMETKGDSFRCTCCGKHGVYTDKGFLAGEGLKFDSVYDWGKWMEGRFVEDMKKRLETEAQDQPLFTDTDVELYEIMPDHQLETKVKGKVIAYRDHLEVESQVFEYKNIPVMSMLYYGKTLLFDYDKRHFGITGEHFHAWKYNSFHNMYLEEKKKQKEAKRKS